MDREKKDELPKMQLGFIDLICLPLYKTLSETFPWLQPLYSGTSKNRQHWEDLAEKVDMGLTWIDHDTIENPVEEFGRKRKQNILRPQILAASPFSLFQKKPSHGNLTLFLQRLTAVGLVLGVGPRVTKGPNLTLDPNQAAEEGNGNFGSSLVQTVRVCPNPLQAEQRQGFIVQTRRVDRAPFVS